MDLTLEKQIITLRKEFASFKLEMETRTENEISKLKCQLGQLMKSYPLPLDVLSLPSSTSAATKVCDKMYFNFSSEISKNLHQQCSVTENRGLRETLEVFKKSIKDSDQNDNTQTLEAEPKCFIDQMKDKKEDQQMNGSTPNSKQMQIMQKDNFPKIKNCCLTCSSKNRLVKQELKKTNIALKKIKNLEKLIIACLQQSKEFVNSSVKDQLKSVSKQMDTIYFDVKQCWSEVKKLNNKDIIMLNGDPVQLEDEIGRLGFQLEAMWSQNLELSAHWQKDSICQHLKIQNLFERLKQMNENNQWAEPFQNKLNGDSVKLEDEIGRLDFQFEALWSQSEELSARIDHLHETSICQHLTIKNLLETMKQLKDNNQCDQPIESKAHTLRIFPIKKVTMEFKAPETTDSLLLNGTTRTVKVRHQCLTAMTCYENQSLEELRYMDYKELDLAQISSASKSITITSFSGRQSLGNFYLRNKKKVKRRNNVHMNRSNDMIF